MGFMALIMCVTVGCAEKKILPEEGGGVLSDQSISLTPVDRAAKAITDGIVYFEFDKFDIQSQYHDLLRQKAELLKQYPSIRIRIEGNCDERGTAEYNLALGGRRARAAYDYLLRLGVNPAQMEIISYGKERPAVLGSGPAAWDKNRRDDFQILSR
jgi:peptidoglycan-associated lipoprotein